MTQAIITTTTVFHPNHEGGVLTFEFSNGTRLQLDSQHLSADVLIQALMHGLKQKLSDAAAISRNTETGRSASVVDKYEAVKAVADRLMAGQWNKNREGGGASGGLLFRALCQLYTSKTPDEIKAFLAGKTDEEKAALRAAPKVAAIIATLRTAKTDVDTDGMLGELGA